MKIPLYRAATAAATALLLAVAPIALTGCSQDEEVLDIETPEGELEVESDPDTGATEIETEP